MSDENTPAPPTTPHAGVNPDDVSRIIVLVYGTLDEGGPFWCYVAVKPSKYEAFQKAEAVGDINLYEFSDYGEVIVSGQGQTPPEEVTLKVAEMYDADPSTFFQPINPIDAVEEKIKEWGKNPPKN